MFYSQWLLSKRGPLGIVWVAAHCYKRLKKEQVAQTNISSSVDQILLDEVPVVTYRILGYLLLGVVRIYSKKVEHLFHDCRDVLIKINDFAGSKKANVYMEAMCAPYLSITLPERFELDAFDLEILEDLSGGNVRPREEITLKDAWKNEGIGHYSFEKYHFEEDAAHFETSSTAYTPVRDVRSPHLLDSDMVASASHNVSNLEASMEKLRGKRFSTEECLDPMLLVEAEEEPSLVGPFGGEHQTGGEQIKFLDTEVFFGAEKEPPDLLRSFDDEQQTDEVQIKFPEIVSPESIKSQLTMQEHPVSIAINVTPESKFPNACNWEASMEKLRGKRFSTEECLDSMMLGEAEEEPSLVGPFGGEHQTDGEQIKFLDTEMFFGAEKEPSDLLGSV
ncbi:hypothetical protein F0562_004528 [Nyssa sinensis]|uniref:Rad21/Rec8-like protein N-terminal domain-containing protein n=1 Tax=Nyssa sinensis TaxID=561372 RepID=A0A5J5C3N4_9ASTE|nr:hypothetical protein F0562_004528 [Nyssa sinensis]